MNLGCTLALVIPLLLIGCGKGRGKKPSTDDTSPAHDTGPASDTEPDCDTGHLDDDGECVPTACGTGTWGNLELDESTIYVDIAAAEGGDGSETAPFTSIQAGLDAAGDADGGMVAVAAGTYAETLELGRSHDGVHLAGRCRQLVVIDASVGDAWTPGIDIELKSYEAKISGITVSGSLFVGMRIDSGTAELRDLAVVGSEYIGIAAFQEGAYDTMLELESCEVLENELAGLLLYDSGTSVTLQGTSITDNQPDGNGNYGYGIAISSGATLSATASEIAGNSAVGLLAYEEGTRVTLQETIIQDTQPQRNGSGGYGIQVYGGASLTLESGIVSGNTAAGVAAEDTGTTVYLRETTIQGTQSAEDGGEGYGVYAYGGANLEAEGCELSQNTTAGVFAGGSSTKVTLLRTAIRDNLPDQDGEGGFGVYVDGGASLEAEGCEVSGNSEAGIHVWDSGSTVGLQETMIRGTQANEVGEGGFGIVVKGGGTLSAESCELSQNTGIGVLAYESETAITLRETTIQGTLPNEDEHLGYGIEVHGGATLLAEACEVSGNTAVGIAVSGAGTTATLQETTIRDTLTFHDDKGGVGTGIVVEDMASLVAEGCVVSGNGLGGVLAQDAGTTASLQGTAILKHLPAEEGEFGYGIWVIDDASLTAQSCEVSGNATIGVVVGGSGTAVELQDTVVRDTKADGNGAGYGIGIFGSASLTAQACEVSENTAGGVVVTDSGTSVSLRETTIRDTLPYGEEGIGYGIGIMDSASLTVESCEVTGNTSAGVFADGSGTSVSLRDTTVASTKLGGEALTVGVNIVVQTSASVEASGLEVSGSEGPGFYLAKEDTRCSCTDCSVSDNQFAGAVVVNRASLSLDGSVIERTSVQENLGGGVGIFADPWSGDPPTLSVTDTTIQDNAIAGVWLSGQGSYSLSDNAIRGGEGWTRESLTKCGDAVYARDGVTAWDGSSGLLLENNDLLEGLGAGLFLDNAMASLSGNRYADNAVDLVVQGADCGTAPVGYEGEALASAELCPSYDYATCGDEFMLFLELAEPEKGYGAAFMRPYLPGPGAAHFPSLPVALPHAFEFPPLLPPVHRQNLIHDVRRRD